MTIVGWFFQSSCAFTVDSCSTFKNSVTGTSLMASYCVLTLLVVMVIVQLLNIAAGLAGYLDGGCGVGWKKVEKLKR